MVTAFKDCFARRETLRSTEQHFEDLGFRFDQAAHEAELASHGQRRSRAAGYIATLDLTGPSDAHRLVKAIALKLGEWQRDASADPRDLARLWATLDNAGFAWDGTTLLRRSGPFAVVSLGQRLRDHGVEGIGEEVDRIQASVDADPADAITAARALVETTCKFVLEEMGEPVPEADELPALYKKAARALQLDPAQHETSYRQTLQGLASSVQGLAEVRNRVGDAHGRSRAAVRPRPRHARMAAGAATTIATFLMETLEERRGRPGSATRDEEGS